MYDFILFENFHQATNHYKDICIIARYLTSAGFSVAIADVFQEDKYCVEDGIPHISIKAKNNIDITIKHKKNNFFEFFVNSRTQLRVNSYLNKVVKELKPIARSFYVGSYHCGMSVRWIKSLAEDKVVFFWGLRSSRLIEYRRRPFSPVGINSFILWRYLRRHINVHFFVSDQLIKQEFIKVGIAESRLIIRPERYIQNLPPSRTSNPDRLRLLSVGSLRKTKRIELCLEALKVINDLNILYVIAGKTDAQYEQSIQKEIGGQNVKRLNYRIPEDEYEKLFLTNDFLFLGDEKQPSLVTNGTMNEALLRGMPIIAPDYDPYRFYINHFGVGILYNPEDIYSLVDAILVAKEKGCGPFQTNVRNYAKQFLYDSVINEFKRNFSSL